MCKDHSLDGIVRQSQTLLKQWFKRLANFLSATEQQYSWVLHRIKMKKKETKHNILREYFLTWGNSKSSFNSWEGLPLPPRCQSCLIGFCASAWPNQGFTQKSQEVAPSGCAPPRLLLRGMVFPEKPARTAVVLWLGSWRPCGQCSGRSGTSWAGVAIYTLWHDDPGLHSCSTYESRNIQFLCLTETCNNSFFSCYSKRDQAMNPPIT